MKLDMLITHLASRNLGILFPWVLWVSVIHNVPKHQGLDRSQSGIMERRGELRTSWATSSDGREPGDLAFALLVNWRISTGCQALCYGQSYGFSSRHVWMWELDHKEGWALKNWCFWTVVLEKTLESPLDCKEIQPVLPKEISPKYPLERLMLKLKLQCFDQPTHQGLF